MSTAKFEKLIDLIINEDQERAEQLFHEIVVEKSREIYESLMDEELGEDQATDLMQEIEAEETMGEMTMEDEVEDEEVAGDFDTEEDMDDMEAGDEAEMDDEMDADAEMGDMGSEEAATKDDIMDLEDKLDQLLAAFEEEFGASDEEEGEEEGGEEEGEEESGVMEAVEMKKVSVTHTDGSDSGAKKSPVDTNSGQAGMAAKPVNFSGGGDEKGRSAPASKDMGMKFKNAPGADGSKTEAAPKPETKQASGVNVKDVVPESRKSVKRMIK